MAQAISPGKKMKVGLLKPRKAGKYVLHLYIAGLSPRSQKALLNIKKICDKHMPGGYKLVVQDIYQTPLFAKNGQIVAAPTLIKMLPLPLRRFVGDMSNTERLLVGLDLRTPK